MWSSWSRAAAAQAREPISETAVLKRAWPPRDQKHPTLRAAAARHCHYLSMLSAGISIAVDFRAYAAQPDAELELLEGALLIAGDARPGLDRSAVERQLDELAAPLQALPVAQLPPRAQARALG